MKVIEKTYYNNNREANPRDFTQNSIAPHLYVHKGGGFFYSVFRGKKAEHVKKVLLKLDSKNIVSSILEVEKKGLFKNDAPESSPRRLEEMKLGYRMAFKVQGAIESFTWGGFARLKLIHSFAIKDLKFEHGNIFYNPYWVNINHEKEIVIRLRDFVMGKP